ncbi:MAG: cell wall-binding protein [Lachnospiraceae bacterium]|jgi:glucan-binding YG repeat protein|nr:cell wall-binding protein [Lachnospiraceae bacterium]NBJ82200.1 cell wall-binding protein [bacterium 1XD42-76]NBK05672.1 cell wall-binding protein [bacterium 1XD42-94]
MKKGFKILTAAMMLSLGLFTMSAYAEGWSLSNNTWIYLDNNGNRVTNEWRKGADNLWRYLNGSGEMSISTWADNEYYVDSNGIMVTNQWQQLRDPYDDYGETYWFYFGGSGKMIRDGWKKIDGKNYLFDSDGIMQTGWSDDGMYYLGSDGAMKTGWRYLEPQERDDDEDSYSGPESDDGKYWYYFSPNGKKFTPAGTDAGGDYRVSKVNGKYYCFNYDGQMQTGWVYMEGDPETADKNSIEHWRYFAEDGIKNTTLGTPVTGWLSLEPPEPLQDNVDEPVVWYYFNKDGTPKTGPDYEEVSTNDFVRINSKSYLFNQRGNPVHGLLRVQIGDTGEYTSYYFDESSRTALTGKRKIEEGDGTESTFYFNEGTNAGRGFTGVKSGYLYYMGKRQEADSDSRYVAISLPAGSGYHTYVVNTSGRVSKNTTVKDRDGNKYKVNSTGILQELNGEAVGSEKFGDPVEPVYEENDF